MSKTVVADSSFYICFLDDINHPEFLVKAISGLGFAFGSVIKSEIEKSRNIHKLTNKNKIESFEYESFSEILRPFFSVSEIRKGETEVIAISVIMSGLGRDILIILDEDFARKYLENNFPEMKHRMTGTIGFIRDGYFIFSLFTKDECLKLLVSIRESNFRVKRLIIDEAIACVENFRT